jgi:phosphate transport system substrate-binding protein
VTRTSIRRAVAPAVAILALSLSLTACGDDAAGSGDNVSGEVAVDGSSTVYPMSNTAAELLSEENSDVQVSVGFAGTGGGFEKFCAGDTDISDASRPIKDDEEVPVCEENDVEFTELLVATDALTVVVHKDLAVDCLTTDQVISLFGPKSEITNWKQLDPSFPDQKIAGFIPGTDSGTYDYMASDVVGDDSGALREDFESSEDDNVLVQGVAGTKGAVGFFGYTYYEENAETLKAVQIDDGNGCVEPSAETARAGEYTPLARPLFIYVSNSSYIDNEAVKVYTDFYIENLTTIAETAQYIPLSDEEYAQTQAALEGIAG